MKENKIKVKVALWGSVPHPLTYSLLTSREKQGLIGCRVVVPIGNRKLIGVITETDVEYHGRLKSVESVLDLEAVLSASQLKLSHFVSEYYYAPLGDVIRSSIPQALASAIKQSVKLLQSDILKEKAEAGSKTAATLLSKFASGKVVLSSEIAGINKAGLRKLIAEDIICYDWELRNYREPQQQMMIKAVSNTDYTGKLSKQGELILDYLSNGLEIELSDLRRTLNINLSSIKTLQKHKLIELSEKEPFLIHESSPNKQIIKLTNEQLSAVKEIKQSLDTNSFKPILLHGVTGSGKTEVYIEAIKHAISQGKRAIFLVPEIGLSQATYYRLQHIFADQIALIHSRLTPSNRLKIWQETIAGKINVVMGPRSALFSPMPNLGLIVVDEEHDAAYKQESPSPRYHGRDLAIYRSKIENCTVILGSATPSVESFFNAKAGKYQLLSLHSRVDQRQMPVVEQVNLKEIFKNRGYSFVTEDLVNEIQDALDKDGQVILLLNRRGFAPSVHCFSCGERFFCQNCAVSLVYHKDSNSLLCHMCGYKQPYPSECPKCSSNLFLYKGIGTQKLQEELLGHFPDIKIVRLDMDVTRRKEGFKDVYTQFYSGKAKILIGTQMVAKGFDFPDVALVGIVSADTSLEFPDFRARERTFQLLTQASGRAGRKRFPGKVILQTLHPEEQAIQLAAKHDYLSFYQSEIAEREELNFPPFSHLILIHVESQEQNLGLEKSNLLVEFLQAFKEKPYQVMGSIPAPIYKLKNRFRYHLLLKTNRVYDSLTCIDSILQHKSLQRSSKLSIIVNVDPVDML